MSCELHNQHINDDCFVCGYDNPAGLHAQFIEGGEPGQIVGLFTPRPEHMSYPGRCHGGVAAAMLDETIGRAIISMDPSLWGVTMKLSLRYVKPTPLGEELIVRGTIDRVTRRTFEGHGSIERADGTVCVTAEATYMRLPVERIVGEMSDAEPGDDELGYVWDEDTRPIPEDL